MNNQTNLGISSSASPSALSTSLMTPANAIADTYGACCIKAGYHDSYTVKGYCVDSTSEVCNLLGGTWLGVGSSCHPDPCCLYASSYTCINCQGQPAPSDWPRNVDGFQNKTQDGHLHNWAYDGYYFNYWHDLIKEETLLSNSSFFACTARNSHAMASMRSWWGGGIPSSWSSEICPCPNIYANELPACGAPGCDPKDWCEGSGTNRTFKFTPPCAFTFYDCQCDPREIVNVYGNKVKVKAGFIPYRGHPCEYCGDEFIGQGPIDPWSGKPWITFDFAGMDHNGYPYYEGPFIAGLDIMSPTIARLYYGWHPDTCPEGGCGSFPRKIPPQFTVCDHVAGVPDDYIKTPYGWIMKYPCSQGGRRLRMWYTGSGWIAEIRANWGQRNCPGVGGGYSAGFWNITGTWVYGPPIMVDAHLTFHGQWPHCASTDQENWPESYKALHRANAFEWSSGMLFGESIVPGVWPSYGHSATMPFLGGGRSHYLNAGGGMCWWGPCCAIEPKTKDICNPMLMLHDEQERKMKNIQAGGSSSAAPSRTRYAWGNVMPKAPTSPLFMSPIAALHGVQRGVMGLWNNIGSSYPLNVYADDFWFIWGWMHASDARPTMSALWGIKQAHGCAAWPIGPWHSRYTPNCPHYPTWQAKELQILCQTEELRLPRYDAVASLANNPSASGNSQASKMMKHIDDNCIVCIDNVWTDGSGSSQSQSSQSIVYSPTPSQSPTPSPSPSPSPTPSPSPSPSASSSTTALSCLCDAPCLCLYNYDGNGEYKVMQKNLLTCSNGRHQWKYGGNYLTQNDDIWLQWNANPGRWEIQEQGNTGNNNYLGTNVAHDPQSSTSLGPWSSLTCPWNVTWTRKSVWQSSSGGSWALKPEDHKGPIIVTTGGCYDSTTTTYVASPTPHVSSGMYCDCTVHPSYCTKSSSSFSGLLSSSSSSDYIPSPPASSISNTSNDSDTPSSPMPMSINTGGDN